MQHTLKPIAIGILENKTSFFHSMFLQLLLLARYCKSYYFITLFIQVINDN